MFQRILVLIALAASLAAPSSKPLRASADAQQTLEQIRRALALLPYYGVFDFLAFRYEKGTVTLSGYAYRPLLKNEAVSAVKRVAGVDEVIDDIELLPVSLNDDRIRWATFYRVYDDAFLSRYAAGGGLTRFDRRFASSRYPGMQPVGMYPIHIIVSGGRTRLLGVVDSDGDRTLVAFRAREIPGTFAVENELMVR